MSKNVTKQIVFSAMAIALATVISVVVKLPSLPNGGSVTLFSMLMITLIGYWYGAKMGLCAAVAYGIIQYFVGPYAIHPLQVLLDYPLAFGALGLSGFFSNAKHGLIKGYLAGVIGRYAVHMVSGLIFYTAYTGSFVENKAAVIAAFTYNATYIVPEAVLTLVLLSIPAIKNALVHVKKLALS
ncbi:MAG: energy-coupled thiamine transporter ThiT [Eubacteriales bacterium]